MDLEGFRSFFLTSKLHSFITNADTLLNKVSKKLNQISSKSENNWLLIHLTCINTLFKVLFNPSKSLYFDTWKMIKIEPPAQIIFYRARISGYNSLVQLASHHHIMLLSLSSYADQKPNTAIAIKCNILVYPPL